MELNKLDKNIAVIGCGYWGKNLVRNFAELGVLHTICDFDSRILESFKSVYPKVNIETDYYKILANQQIKGVVIATPSVSHYAMAKEALNNDKDIFIEKPLTLAIEQGKELVELAENNNKILLVGHVMEYHPAVVKLKELVDRGKLGKINYIYSNRLNLGKFRSEENTLWSLAPHDISIILLLLGEMPQEVSAYGGYYRHRDIADVTLTVLGFRDNVNAHIFVSWLHPYKEQRVVVVGEEKMAMFDAAEDKLFVYNHEIEWVGKNLIPHQGEPEIVDVALEEPLKLECQDFIKCIETRQRPRADGRKGLQVLEILSECQRSLAEGGKVIFLNKQSGDCFIHETSVAEKPYRIGNGTKIWHFSHIMPGVVIGTNCVIGQNIFIGAGVKIGNNVKIENNVSVFEAVTLEDDVFCGPSCVFTNDLNPRSQISRRGEFKSTLVKKGATIGANATIVCGHTIGKYAFIGAGAVVTSDIPDYALYFGNPARFEGWVCECGVKLVSNKEDIWGCTECGKKYLRLGEKGNRVMVEKLE